MGLQDRDYMRERGRRAQYVPSHGHGRQWSLPRLGGMGTLSRYLVVGIGILLAFVVIRYALTYRAAVPFPTTGDVHWYINDAQPRMAQLRLHARPSSSSKYFTVMVNDWASSAPVAMIPVRSGETSLTLMPLGRYRLTIAKGSLWMGPDKRFGMTGESRTVVHPLEFYQRGNQIYGHSIDLEVPFAGNLETSPDLTSSPWR